MTIVEFEEALQARGYTTRNSLQQQMGTAALNHQWHAVAYVDVLHDGVLAGTYNEAVIRIMFTSENIDSYFKWI